MEELLEAAASVFYEKGYDAATLQDIANRVGILKGSIYYYIQSKADLRDHLVVEVHRNSLAMVKRLAQTEGTALHKLAAIIRGHVDYIARNLVQVTVSSNNWSRLIQRSAKGCLAATTTATATSCKVFWNSERARGRC